MPALSFTGLFDRNHLYGLLLNGIERLALIGDLTKIDSRQIDATYRTVIHRIVIDSPMGHIGNGRPLGCAGDVGRLLAW